MRQFCDKNDWFCEGQHWFRPGYSCESQVITVCQDTADHLYQSVVIDVIINNHSKVFHLVPRYQLRMKLAAWGVDSNVVVWVREFNREGVYLSKEVKLTLVVPQTCVSCPLIFVVYVNYIWRNIDTNIRLFADAGVPAYVHRQVHRTHIHIDNIQPHTR
jgi:hypothetical protein